MFIKCMGIDGNGFDKGYVFIAKNAVIAVRKCTTFGINGTMIYTVSDNFLVKESVEEVMDMLTSNTYVCTW